MKKLINSFYQTVIIIAILNSLIFAQNVDVKLAGSDSTKAFYIINDNGDTLFTIRGDGVIKLEDNTYFNSSEYLMSVSGQDESAFGDNRDVKILSGADIVLQGARQPFQEGGRISIFGGGSSTVRGGIEIIGGSEDDGLGNDGMVTVHSGDDSDLNLYGGGHGSQNGNYGGDVNIEASKGGTTGNVNIVSGEGNGVQDAGDINVTGGEGIEARGGDINLTPGLGTSGGTNGSVQIYGSGTYTGTWTQVSDRKYMREVEKLDNTKEKILALQAAKYEWKTEDFPEKHFEKGKQIGLIAQDVEKIFPELVGIDSEGTKSLDYSKLTVLLLEVVKEQQKVLEQLQIKIEEQK